MQQAMAFEKKRGLYFKNPSISKPPISIQSPLVAIPINCDVAAQDRKSIVSKEITWIYPRDIMYSLKAHEKPDCLFINAKKFSEVRMTNWINGKFSKSLHTVE